jgi:hypothetical protein
VNERYAEYEAGRRKGAEDRAAGIAPQSEEAWDASRGHGRLFASGYRAGIHPDEPAEAPLAPLGVVAFTAVESALGAWYYARRSRRRLALSLAATVAVKRAEDLARREAARRAGWPTQEHAPPRLFRAGTIALNWGLTYGTRRGRFRRRWATQFGIALPIRLRVNAEWRRENARWRAHRRGQLPN